MKEFHCAVFVWRVAAAHKRLAILLRALQPVHCTDRSGHVLSEGELAFEIEAEAVPAALDQVVWLRLEEALHAAREPKLADLTFFLQTEGGDAVRGGNDQLLILSLSLP